jgi:hypothetical protein
MLSLSPKNTLRAAAILCLIGCGASAVYETSHIGPGFNRFGLAHDLAIFFFFGLLVFALFVGEYQGVEQLLKRELNRPLGYQQAVGSLLTLIFGAYKIYSAHQPPVNPIAAPSGNNTLRNILVILIVGHVLFAVNVAWSYLRKSGVARPTAAASSKTPSVAPKKTLSVALKRIGWPSSPAVIFGVAAAFFGVMGIVFVNTRMLGSRLPMIRHGQTVFVPIGHLVPWVAAPFAIFCVIYAGIELGARRAFQESATRIHFVCTLFAALEVVRVYGTWAATTANMQPAAITQYSFGGAAVLLGLASAAFAWNVYTSKPKRETAR